MNICKLSASDKKLLLKLARETINDYVRNGTISQKELSAESLLTHQGCFVSIKIGGMLRGCIGNFTSDKPLFQLVREMAVSAATRDPRFYPIKTNDLEEYVLEISVLSSLQKIASIEEIEVGTHGLYLEKNFSRGVLLPQVAVEYDWNRDTFLQQTSLKAGLEADGWREGATIYTFTAEVFSDKERS